MTSSSLPSLRREQALLRFARRVTAAVRELVADLADVDEDADQ